LFRSALLRLDDRQGHRLRRHARAGDRPDADRSVRDGRGGNQDEHSAAPGASARREVRPRRNFDPLPRREAREAEAGRVADATADKDRNALSTKALRFDADVEDADRWSDALLDAGAQSVDVADARADTADETPIYDEPGEPRFGW